MRKINLFSYLIVVVLAAVLLIGCPARKPDPVPEAPAPPETIIVPEVSRIFFTEVQLEEGPELARLLVANNREGEMTVWFEADEQIWVLVQSPQDSDEILKIDEVLARVPGRDTTLLEVRLSEEVRQEETQEEETSNQQQQFDAMLVRLDLNQRPHGVAFLFDSRLEEDLEENNGQTQEQAAPAPAAPPKQQPQQQKPPQQRQEEQTFIQVQEPSPNSTVTSPIQILGRARVPGGTVHVRLKNAGGEVIAESTTTATAAAPQIGNFSATLSFSPPGEEMKGTLEVFTNGRSGQEENIVAVPVVIK
ncbi:MAG: Gmad2 immunoglobulin-like domain-containing protein [Bacillota bacterium]|nr:Gmad2 immunoglobulin-like domain-containing protein [Bacillota bacterium]